MHSDEITLDLLIENFNTRSFLMFLRRENERNREISIQPTKYGAFIKSRGFARLTDFHLSNSAIPSRMISENGIIIADNLSQQLLEDNLTLVRRHWRRSKMNFSDKMAHIQSEFNVQTSISLKKAISEYQKTLSNWISKNKRFEHH